MACGLDVAGLALAIFPLVVSTVDWYGGRVKSGDIKPLAQSLRNNEHIFLDSVEYLLRGIVSAEELQVLLKDPGGDAWRTESLNDRVMEHLGERAGDVLANVNDIYQTILKLSKKLPKPDNAAVSDQTILKRAKLVMKAFLHGKLYHASLERLRARVNEFQQLTKGAINLASTRCTYPRALKNLELVQECASGLYDAVQAGWKCTCDHPHPANIKLDVWCTREQESDSIRLQFSLLFADDPKDAHDDHWMTAEITLDKARSSSLRPNTLQSGTSAASKTISLSVTGSTSNTSHDGQEHVEDLINNLCDLLKNLEDKDLETPPRTGRRRHGSISDPANGHSYDLLSKADEPLAAPNKSSTLGQQLFNQKTPLSMKSRLQLGYTLAWAVLQISSTNWFCGKWTKDNILLVMDVQGKPKPYVSHLFEPSGRNPQSPTMVPTTENEVADWIQNASLFALGVFLIELCHNKSIEDLAIDKEKSNGEPLPMTSFLTAIRLSKSLHEELGVHYEQAVNACLHPQDFDMDPKGNPKDSSQFAKSMMKNIIEPLKIVTDRYEK